MFEEILFIGLINLIEDDIARGIQERLQPITQSIMVDAGEFCPRVRIDEAGNGNFELVG